MPINSSNPGPDSSPNTDSLLQQITAQRFREWYREREYRRNIEDGKPYFNGAASFPNPGRHSPSKLLQCHRKIYYRKGNAPEERDDPDGIFWFGTRFEEDIIFPFFQEVLTDDETYVRNTVWVDFTAETDVGELRIKGATDPLIVDSDAVPILPTEIKTKESLEYVTEPNRHHRAQLHAYMYGLSEKYDIDLHEGIILYGSRKSLDVEFFTVQFDRKFWEETVLDWAETHTEYRLDDQLPPSQPEYDWECKFCSYRERCGKGSENYEDSGTIGLLPTVDYPREKLVEYLEAYPEARLPPSLADEFPEVAEKHGAYDWHCGVCGNSTAWNENKSQPSMSIVCSECSSQGVFEKMGSPPLSEQCERVLQQQEKDNAE